MSLAQYKITLICCTIEIICFHLRKLLLIPFNDSIVAVGLWEKGGAQLLFSMQQ